MYPRLLTTVAPANSAALGYLRISGWKEDRLSSIAQNSLFHQGSIDTVPGKDHFKRTVIPEFCQRSIYRAQECIDLARGHATLNHKLWLVRHRNLHVGSFSTFPTVRFTLIFSSGFSPAGPWCNIQSQADARIFGGVAVKSSVRPRQGQRSETVLNFQFGTKVASQ
jgi:hypothetical protein